MLSPHANVCEKWHCSQNVPPHAKPAGAGDALSSTADALRFSSACSSSIIATYLSSRRLALLAKMRSYLPVIDPKSPGLFPARIASLIRAHVDAFCVDLASTPLGNATFCVEPFSS